ncbi:NAD(P)H-dependent oxidoreductase [Actinoalloteichus sp. GBA129-24]|uniref:membrane protein YczE n=1 Tax=Actinoalloteichus sp. GBA129-24 TaxID=1612551 RepID=UPI001E3BE536|nr:NAD(P)H-dependent oxidoreductase [Actinoalloteichus sp. GBA129-24]
MSTKGVAVQDESGRPGSRVEGAAPRPPAGRARVDLPRRLARLAVGLPLFSLGLAMMLNAGLGLSPWDVFHQGLALRTGLPFGVVVIGAGVVVLALWIPLRQRPGIGTVLNIASVGVLTEAALTVLPEPAHPAARAAFLLAGLLINAIGLGLYLGAGLGPGPRDGLMTGLAARGWTIRRARTGVEVGVLAIGWLLGGTVGIGTVLYAVGIGPLLQVLLPRLSGPPHPRDHEPAAAALGGALDPPPDRRDRRGAPITAAPQQRRPAPLAPPVPSPTPLHSGEVPMPVLHVIVASTRPGRLGPAVARWCTDVAVDHGGFEVRTVDLGELALPFLDEPEHPAAGRYRHQHTKDWSALVDSADAFVFVMPEYNFGFNAVVKNAVDFLYSEWHYKPVGFVSYGMTSGGLRAVQMLKQVVTTLKMSPVTEAVSIPFVSEQIQDGVLLDDPARTAACTRMLDELGRLSAALAPLRSERVPS